MRPNSISLARVLLVLFGLINLNHVFSLLSYYETMASAPPCLSFWGWHVILSLVYGVLPIIAVLIGTEESYLMVTGVSIIGILMEAFNVFTWVTNLSFVFVLLNSLAAGLSLHLAVEKVAMEVAAEILGSGWTQF